ncbi:MAG TPA: dihydroorotate dehydrogenase electron transfer subunit [Candidatus Dormibacteraeota bacterium]|nr:dihydroorotate dehydrogenase electron transfer subunit [Candidatus Dormibacteraeota bacterium]
MSPTANATSAKGLAGESDLGRAIEELAECSQLRPLARNLFEITFQSPAIAELARPGEFAQIWVERSHIPLLRRPFSFSRADRRDGTVAFYLGVVGDGSRRLRALSPGDRVRILGPLGRGFTLPETPGRSALILGGLGAAPFPLLAERLRQLGEEVVWVNGARTADELYPDELIPPGVQEIVQFTEDGSQGSTGRITAGLLPLLKEVDRVYACGPNHMLGAVFQLISSSSLARLPLEVSIEAPMGCGFGTCLGCAIPLRADGTNTEPVIGLCCRQGPVLRGSLLDWEQLLLQPAHLA